MSLTDIQIFIFEECHFYGERKNDIFINMYLIDKDVCTDTIFFFPKTKPKSFYLLKPGLMAGRETS